MASAAAGRLARATTHKAKIRANDNTADTRISSGLSDEFRDGTVCRRADNVGAGRVRQQTMLLRQQKPCGSKEQGERPRHSDDCRSSAAACRM